MKTHQSQQQKRKNQMIIYERKGKDVGISTYYEHNE